MSAASEGEKIDLCRSVAKCIIHVEMNFDDFIPDNQLYNKTAVQLFVNGKEGANKLLSGSERIRKGVCFE